jgi:multiple sugar transport system substrate-binding protein
VKKGFSIVAMALLLTTVTLSPFHIRIVDSQPTITVIGPWAGVEKETFLPVLEMFENETDINVEYKIVRSEDLATILPPMFEANMTPGDVIFMWPWFIQEAAREAHILDVADLIDETDFMPGSLDLVRVDDTLYGGAYTGKSKTGFWYRKSFFNMHGLTPPETYEEFTTLIDAISSVPDIRSPIVSGDSVGWPLSDIAEHFLLVFGGPQLQLDLISGKAKWTSPEVRSIFENKLTPLLEGEYFSEPLDWLDALSMWWDGDYGLYFMGSWITAMVDDPEDLGVFPLPAAEGLVFAADYFFIPAYTERSEEAKQLFTFLASAEAQETQVRESGHIATNIHVPLDAYPPADRRVAEVMEGMTVVPDLDDTIGGEFQVTFWDQLKLLWTHPECLDEVLEAIQAVAPQPPPQLLGVGWGKMKIDANTTFCGRAELYKIVDPQIKLVILREGETHTRTWDVIYHREHKHSEIYICYNRRWGFLIVGLHEHRRWQFWYAVGKSVIAFGHPKLQRLIQTLHPRI